MKRDIFLALYTVFSTFFRKRKYYFFLKYLNRSKHPLTILDLGGTEYFWNQIGLLNHRFVNILLLNNQSQKTHAKNIVFLKRDARNLNSFKSKEFDIVFSNSLIEHLPDYGAQKKFASEVTRIGKNYLVQTPYKYFPIEPHFFIPFFFLMPPKLKPYLVKYFSPVWKGTNRSLSEARHEIESIRLLNTSEMQTLFKGSNLRKEKFLGLTKSLIAYSL